MKKYLLSLLTIVAVCSCTGSTRQTSVSFDDVVASRRSIRSFDASKSISEAQIRTLIMGGRDATAIRSIFNIPESETIMAVIALGYRAADPQRPVRKPLDEIVTFF